MFTEAATGSYLFTPIIAALAGADKVYAYTRDSKYGSKEKVQCKTLEVARQHGISNITVLFQKSIECVADSDIITNSGFVRPIDETMINAMKPTAVVPLMFETWEFRSSDIDLKKCKEKGILVLGTNESSFNMLPTVGYLALKLLFEVGLEVYKAKVLIIGDNTVGKNIFGVLNNLDINLKFFDGKSKAEEVLANIDQADAIIVSDIVSDIEYIGKKGILTANEIAKRNPFIRIIHICGAIDVESIRAERLFLIPERPATRRFMSYRADYLGPRFAIALNIAGLKVGEVMARCRLKGMGVRETIEYCLKNSPAMDFAEGY